MGVTIRRYIHTTKRQNKENRRCRGRDSELRAECKGHITQRVI
jgi:ribosomal protein L32E